MNYLSFKTTTLPERIEELKKAVQTRDEMGGALYWNMINDDCFEMADQLVKMGGNKDELAKILGTTPRY
jgi:hypothetical protein